VDRILKLVDKNESGEIDYSGNIIKNSIFIIKIIFLLCELIKEWIMATINREKLLSK